MDSAAKSGPEPTFITLVLAHLQPAIRSGRSIPQLTVQWAIRDGRGEDMTGGGATHAWADIFVPGAGWVEFDPTNRIVASRNLIRVATTRTPSQALPVSGTFEHDGGRQLHPEVSVSVARVE